MSLSNTATPYYYGLFRDAVIRGEIPVCQQISMQMNLIDNLIADPRYYYDEDAVKGWILFCENELTLTDGSDLHLLDTFKLWAEQLFGWYYFVKRSIYISIFCFLINSWLFSSTIFLLSILNISKTSLMNFVKNNLYSLLYLYFS
jgi:hypothetical protein